MRVYEGNKRITMQGRIVVCPAFYTTQEEFAKYKEWEYCPKIFDETGNFVKYCGHTTFEMVEKPFQENSKEWVEVFPDYHYEKI